MKRVERFLSIVTWNMIFLIIAMTVLHIVTKGVNSVIVEFGIGFVITETGNAVNVEALSILYFAFVKIVC